MHCNCLMFRRDFMFFQVLEPKSVDYDQVFGEMQSASGDEGGDQKAFQLAGAASSVINSKVGKRENDSAAAEERAAVRTVHNTKERLRSRLLNGFRGTIHKGRV